MRLEREKKWMFVLFFFRKRKYVTGIKEKNTNKNFQTKKQIDVFICKVTRINLLHRTIVNSEAKRQIKQVLEKKTRTRNEYNLQ